MKYFWMVIIALIVIGGGWYAIQSKQGAQQDAMNAGMDMGASTTTSTTTTTTTTETSTSGTTGTGVGVGVDVGVSTGTTKEIIVDGSNFAFIPKEIRVKEGERVRVTFNNSGGTHDFVIDEFNVRTRQIQGGQSDTVEFVPNKKGTFEYYCSVGTHRQMGMRGNLIVE